MTDQACPSEGGCRVCGRFETNVDDGICDGCEPIFLDCLRPAARSVDPNCRLDEVFRRAFNLAQVRVWFKQTDTVQPVGAVGDPVPASRPATESSRDMGLRTPSLHVQPEVRCRRVHGSDVEHVSEDVAR